MLSNIRYRGDMSWCHERVPETHMLSGWRIPELVSLSKRSPISSSAFTVPTKRAHEISNQMAAVPDLAFRLRSGSRSCMEGGSPWSVQTRQAPYLLFTFLFLRTRKLNRIFISCRI